MDPFGGFPYLTKGLKPVKEMNLEKVVDLVVIVKLSITFLKMPNPVEACAPNLGRKTLLHSSACNVCHKHARSV